MAVKRSAWVKKMKGDPSSPTQLVVVDGYIGDSTHPDHVRIYLDSRLNRYVDVPETAVRHQADIAGSTPPGMQRIWIDPDADIKTAPQTMSARFLEGNLAQTYAARTQPQPAGQARAQTVPGEPVPWRTLDPAFCPVESIPGLNCPIEFTDPRICPPFTTPEVGCPDAPTDPRICNPVTIPGVDCPRQITFAPSTCCLPTRFEPECTHFPEICNFETRIRVNCPPVTEPTVCGVTECGPTGWGGICQNFTIVSECNICITRNTPTICECHFTRDFRCVEIQTRVCTITDPLQLNRMAQGQTLRRAIGRRGLSRR